jgi:hypothetical protein
MKIASLFMLLFALTIGLTTRTASGPAKEHALPIASDVVETPSELQLHDSRVADLICGPNFHFCQCTGIHFGCTGCAPSPSPCDGFCNC